MKSSLSITRVVNSCVLLQFGNDAVLTDPYFTKRWYMKWSEPIGMTVSQLPKLAAIIGGHSVFDHWQMSSLKSYEYKDETPVFVATRSMARKAKAAGFKHVEVLEWNDTRHISDQLSLEVVVAHQALGLRVNNYVLSTPDLTVFCGTEARDLEPIRQYASNRPDMDVVLVPVNGVHLFGRLKLVMNGKDAVATTRILGSKTLVPIHDSHTHIPFLADVTSSASEAAEEARAADDGIEVVRLKSGQEWEYPH